MTRRATKWLVAAALCGVAFAAPIAVGEVAQPDDEAALEAVRDEAIRETQEGYDRMLDKQRSSGDCQRILSEGHKHELCEQVVGDLAAQDEGTYEGRYDTPADTEEGR